MDYVVYSTSNSDYQSWQCRLLEHSFKKVNQPGKLIRLCSFNTHNPNRVFDTSDIAEVIQLPDYRTRWREFTNDLDKDYGIANKTESLKYWLSNYPGLKDTDNVLFIDPDMVFVKAVTETTIQGKVIAQSWVDEGTENGKPFQTYASHIKDRVTADTVFMYPYIATVGDLRKIVNNYVDLTYKMRLENYPHLWESEMYALIISTLEQGIEVKTYNNLGFCLTWAEREKYKDKEFSDSVSLLHFPWSINDKDGNRLFNKQDYTSLTLKEHWDRVNTNKSITFLERKFLQLLDHYNLEKQTQFYWNDTDLIDSMFDYAPKDKYIVFKPWPGGFNNIRMSLEIAACLAFILNRILVLPPEYRMYLLNNTNSMSTFFDINDLGIKTMSFEEFENKFNVVGWEGVKQIAHTIDEDSVPLILTTVNEVPDDIIHGRRIKNINDLANTKIVHFDSNLLGNFYLNIYTNNQPEICKYVARHIHYKKEIFLEAKKAIDLLGSYYAIHIRRGDFQYHDLKPPIETIYNNIKNVIPEGTKLYISTDEADKSFFSLLKQHYNIFFYSDIEHLIYSDINIDLIGPIEQIICTEAITFIGNKLSTFSSYIYRLRGYMKHITDKRFLTYNVECHPDVEEGYWWVATWARDYSEVFESINTIKYFKPQLPAQEPKKIFVSVAAYRDPQLTSTIDSLLTNQSGENEIIVGVCMQDTEENYNEFKYKDHPSVITRFIPYQEAKGVGVARNLVQQELYTNEDYFLQIDSHSKSIKNWDKILINQINKCASYKAILSTYPNSYDPDDEKETYFTHTTCPWLKIERFTDNQKLVATSAGVVDEDHPILGFWCAAGFLFTRGEWAKQVPYSTDFYFAGEEDHLSVMSFVNGWDVYVPESSTIWHNYTDTRMQSPKKYRPLHWEDHTDINHNLGLIQYLYDEKPEYQRQPSEFLELAKRISNYDKTVSIEIEFNYDNIPMHDTSKEVLVIVFAFFNSENQEIFRPDIVDIDIINRNKNNIFLNIPEHVHHQINYCTWFIKYADDTFSERLVLPIQKQSNKYTI
jgi:hypothetical protein